MKSNASLKEIAGILKAAQSILVFTHTNPDGDALGSAAALCRALRKMGKDAWAVFTDHIPEYLHFIDDEYFTWDIDLIKNQDVSICLDCSDCDRFPTLIDKFNDGKTKLCVDHHATADGFGDYYYVDSDAAATCELAYMLMVEMGAEIDKTIAESIYAGINTDTGSFRYSNATSQTHRITAELMEYGIDHTSINVKLYQTIGLAKMRIQAASLDKAEFLYDGKVALGFVTDEMLKKASATVDDADDNVDMLRNIEGVEMAVFLKEKGDNVKVSMRSKSYANVNEIAASLGGGGHAKAAGCTLEMSMEDAIETMKKALEDYWQN